MITKIVQNLGERSGVIIMMENNVGEGEKKLYRCFRKNNGRLTVQRVFKDRH